MYIGDVSRSISTSGKQKFYLTGGNLTHDLWFASPTHAMIGVCLYIFGICIDAYAVLIKLTSPHLITYTFNLVDSDAGYVHSLSPMKKGRSGKNFYSFQLQTDETTLIRSVGFDKNTHAKVNHYHVTGSPVKLVNVNKKQDQIFVNSFSSIFEASRDDIKFTKMEHVDSGESSKAISSSIDIKLEQLQSLATNQKVNVEGILSLGAENPKEVSMRDGQKGLVKEDCVIEDETGTAALHIWQNSIEEAKDGAAYKITNVSSSIERPILAHLTLGFDLQK